MVTMWDVTNNATFALEMQQPWAKHLLEGRKTIEVRAYPLPPELIGTRIWILESQQGKDGVSGLGDRIELGYTPTAAAKIVGWCCFSSVKTYTQQADFEADETHHLVSSDSGYTWKQGKTQELYGWVAGDCNLVENGEAMSTTEPLADPLFVLAVRRKRSLFQLYKKGDQTEA